jgi:hypothetical protein
MGKRGEKRGEFKGAKGKQDSFKISGWDTKERRWRHAKEGDLG